MQRRYVGYANVQHRKLLNRDFQTMSDSIAANELAQLQRQMDVFKTNLQEFARKHRKAIRKDPVFRSHFQRMCANIGVDPLASNKGFWADLLGVGDFYYELGIQVIEGCMHSRSLDGGLTDLGELKRRIERMRGQAHAQEITEDDLLRAIRTLKPLSSGFEVITLGDRKMVRSVPKELDKDQSALLLLAQGGALDQDRIQEAFGWSTVRIQKSLDHLLEDGLCWIDTQADPNSFWVPSYSLTL